ncbi:MAG: AAA family ATPase [Deltaproteobacteria bacterium]|jgi:hypothetical protein|nr:AAA family ATPase [Deltaproteobacteria bacterium]
MDEKQLEYFSILSANREEVAKNLGSFALRGIQKSVVEKYSDQAHFIYELLQNADDARATSVVFQLFPDKLVFTHNGERRFSVSDPATEAEDQLKGLLGDINAITAIGGSNKDAEEDIGKFGLGFKAVFQYTSSPHIYDPNFCFKIERFIVPILLGCDHPGKDNETIFEFPFNHPERTPDIAYSDIKKKLRSLDYPLLFLYNIKYISFEIDDETGMYGKECYDTFEFDDVKVEYITLTQNDIIDRNTFKDDTLWLFTRKDSLIGTYAVGYFVDAVTGRLISKIHPAFCYFPTKLYTNLGFIIHAQFLLTDNREGILAGALINKKLISALAMLAANALVYLKNIGQSKNIQIIDDNIFDVIPYDPNIFTDINNINIISFKPFFDNIKNVFLNEEIIPCKDGFVSKKDAYWSTFQEITEIFTEQQLSFLTKNKNARWVFSSIGRDAMQRKNKELLTYIDSITNSWLSEENILRGESGITAEFIEAQNIGWLHRFYRWIRETKGRMELVKTKPIFLDQNFKAVPAFDKKGHLILFLPNDNSDYYTTINHLLAQNEETLSFIKQLGVQEPSLQDEIYNNILPLYQNVSNIDMELRDKHFKKLFSYYANCSQKDINIYCELLKDYNFLAYNCNNSLDILYGKASDIYFPNKDLKIWFESKPDTKYLCLDNYLQLIDEEYSENLYNFFVSLGVNSSIKICTRFLTNDEAFFTWNDWPKSTKEPIWTEYYIDGLTEILSTIVMDNNLELSALVWSNLLQMTVNNNLSDILAIDYQYFFRKYHKERYDSTDLTRLRTYHWLANRENKFVSPKELHINDLNEIYDVSSDNALILYNILNINYGSSLNNDDNLEDDSKNFFQKFAKELGIPIDDFQEFLLSNKKSLLNKYNKDKTGILDPDDNSNQPTDNSEVSLVTLESTNIIKDIAKRLKSSFNKDFNSEIDDINNDFPVVDDEDEDEYTKISFNVEQEIEKIKLDSTKAIQKASYLADLNNIAIKHKKYSFAWFKSLLELECLNSAANNNKDITISFSKVELADNTSNTLILKQPSRYLSQSLEDLSDITLELHFANKPIISLIVEAVSVKSQALRAKLRSLSLDERDLELVTEAHLETKSPVFLLEEQRKELTKLGQDNNYSDDYDLKANLPENIEFIFGPAGAGKTTYLAINRILPLINEEENLKILVLTPTNKAADVLVRVLIDKMGEDESYKNWLVRFGSTNDPVIEQSGIFRDREFNIHSLDKNITVTTIARFPYDYFMSNTGVRNHLRYLDWDYIIFDEASMIKLVNLVYLLYYKNPKKFIITGDPFQIEPIVEIDTWQNENIYTMVGLNSFSEPKTEPKQYPVKLLTTQYRSVPEIGQVFSQLAYDGVLKHFRSPNSQRYLPFINEFKLSPVSFIKFPVSNYESIYRPKRLQQSVYQIYSALLAFEFIKKIASSFESLNLDKPYRLGLITPYRAQSDLIDRLTSAASFPNSVAVQVGTIHAFQGDECDLLIALFNPPPYISESKQMFINKLNIINVSISRARDYAIILMPDDITQNIDKLSYIKFIERFYNKYYFCSEWQSFEIEEFLFGSKTYLKDNSFFTSRQQVNVYGQQEMLYEIRSENNALDVQLHPKLKNKFSISY